MSQVKILSYFGSKDILYSVLSVLSRQSLQFVRSSFPLMERAKFNLKHANERIMMTQVKSIEEHTSGINQMIQICADLLVSVSDDCTVKFWNSTHMKVDEKINTETITCCAISGLRQDLLISGCHSGNLMIINVNNTEKKETIEGAHDNLLRVVCSLATLKHRYFLTADVCGYIKAWSTNGLKPTLLHEIELEGAISYNSLIECADFLPGDTLFDESATVVACALKHCEIRLIMFVPG